MRATSNCFSVVSFDARKRLELNQSIKMGKKTIKKMSNKFTMKETNDSYRCWFIFARGATPSMAIYNTFLGRTILKRRSMHSKMATIISSSFFGAGLSSGCVHGWIIPFMSRYKLSNSTPFGFGSVASSGSQLPSASSV